MCCKLPYRDPLTSKLKRRKKQLYRKSSPEPGGPEAQGRRVACPGRHSTGRADGNKKREPRST